MLVHKLAVLLADEIFKPVCKLLDPLGDGAGDFEQQDSFPRFSFFKYFITVKGKSISCGGAINQVTKSVT